MAELHRAYSTLEVKGVDDETRIITGIASTLGTDLDGDIVEPAGAQFKLPLPLLWQHDQRQPIGEVFAATVTSKGIEVQARVPRIDVAGRLQDRIEEAWQSLKAKLVKGFSIGFKPLESEQIRGTFGYRYTKWQWFELSCVTIPANVGASIQTIKSFDIGRPAALGIAPEVISNQSAGASASVRVVSTRLKDRSMPKLIADRIKELEATRLHKFTEMEALQAKVSDDGVTKDAEQKAKFNDLAAEIKGLDEELADQRTLEELNVKAAKPVAGATQPEATNTRAGLSVTVKRELPPGYLFARYAMCIGASRGMEGEAIRLAKQHYPDDPGVLQLVQKSPVAGGSTTGSHYLDDMVPYAVMNDFIEFLRPGSIVGKFGGPNPGGGPNYPSLRRVGFNERVSGMSTGYTAAWKGEGLPAIPSAAVTFNMSLLYNNLAALAILTKEAIRFSNPNAEMRVRDDLAKAINMKMDVDFVDPAKAAVSTTSPASITYNIAATPVSGATAATAITDLATLIALFSANNLDPSNIVLIMSTQMALQFSMMTTTLGAPYFPGITMAGGNLRGFPVITSEHLTSVGSPSTQMIVAVKADEVYLADDGVVTVEASDQAAVEMVDSSSQSAIGGTGASLVSLWQTGAVGLMAQREITWKLRRSTAVQYISPAAYKA